jgi:hypothetical protein
MAPMLGRNPLRNRSIRAAHPLECHQKRPSCQELIAFAETASATVRDT